MRKMGKKGRHEHAISLSKNSKGFNGNEVESKRMMEGSKAKSDGEPPLVIDEIVKEGSVKVLVRNVSVNGVAGEYDVRISCNMPSEGDGIDIGFFKECPGMNFNACCDKAVSMLNDYAERQERVLSDTRRLIDVLANAMLGNGDLADKADAFENGLDVMNEALNSIVESEGAE